LDGSKRVEIKDLVPQSPQPFLQLLQLMRTGSVAHINDSSFAHSTMHTNLNINLFMRLSRH
jgi:hypothetical protein